MAGGQRKTGESRKRTVSTELSTLKLHNDANTALQYSFSPAASLSETSRRIPALANDPDEVHRVLARDQPKRTKP